MRGSVEMACAVTNFVVSQDRVKFKSGSGQTPQRVLGMRSVMTNKLIVEFMLTSIFLVVSGCHANIYSFYKKTLKAR